MTWTGSQLEVAATNASLSGLLQEIAAKANLSVTGSVPEEPIFGSYGPGSLDEVLSALLSGLPVNLMLIDHSGTQKKELVLTSRTGGVSPPDPQQQQAAGFTAAPQVFQPAAQGLRPESLVPGAPQNAGTGPSAAPGQFPQAGTPGGSSTDPPVSPNGVKTPQQIFEQLQRLRQQGLGANPQ